jgi:hypothetical protein
MMDMVLDLPVQTDEEMLPVLRDQDQLWRDARGQIVYVLPGGMVELALTELGAEVAAVGRPAED